MNTKFQKKEIDRNLLGTNPVFKKEPEQSSFRYVDAYLEELNSHYPLGSFDFSNLLRNEAMFKEDVPETSDIKISTYVSSHDSWIYDLVNVSTHSNEWRGYVIEDKDPVWFLEELIKEPYSRLTAKRGNRAIRELLVSGYCHSPNLEKKSNFDNRLILVPGQKLIEYLVKLSEKQY